MFAQIRPDNGRTALIEDGRTVSYGELDAASRRFAAGLLGGKADLEEERIAFFLPGSADYVTVMHGVWRAGGIAVPLNTGSAIPELEHYLSTARVTRLVARADDCANLAELCAQCGTELLDVAKLGSEEAVSLPDLPETRRAMILFTSGTTNKPKGVVSTHANIRAQITALIEAWEWSEEDAIPLFLPLHHIHGIINVLGCGLWAGAAVHLFGKFDMERIVRGVAAGDYSLFMAVPTVYVKILQYLEGLESESAEKICSGFGAMRLNVSGSAACPVPLFEQWRKRTGQVLLERYGMTEIGMAISNPYRGERRAGHVGQPLPGVEVRLVDEDGSVVDGEGQPGEIHVRGPAVFLEYWDNPQATAESFTDDGWFCTGDMAVLDGGYYRIMGRSSIDIIKSGGYKLSALEIEGVLLNHPAIAEIAVVGAEDEMWGEAVAAFIVLQGGAQLSFEELKAWCDGRLSSYKVPKRVQFVEALPRNAMGKVTKPDLRPLL